MRMIDERWPAWEGHIHIVIRDERGRFKKHVRLKNLITNAGLNLMRDALGGYVTDTKIRYVAVGTNSTAPAATDIQLGAEVFRKAVTKVDNTVGTGQVKTTLYIAPGEALVGVQEIGWFAGVGATATANSGVMVARVLYAHTHLSSESIQVDRTDTL